MMFGYFIFVAGSCDEEPIAPEGLKGCMDINACNYNPLANIPDTSCMDTIDCTATCGGNSIVDACGVCGGGNSSCTDCSGNVNGNAQLDNCGTCDSSIDNNCQLDCIGQWGGLSQLDECGVCDGNNSSCTDCRGILNGDALIDECGICSGGSTGIEINASCDDCLGVLNGDALEDNCGICDNDYTNNCIQDCNADWGGIASIDECKVCSGGSTNLAINSSCIDCLDIPNGIALEDNCGICDNDSANDCVQDCNGEWGGNTVLDECSVCSGDNLTCTDCNDVIHGLSFIDSCGNCIESIPASWEIEIIAELVLMNSDLDTLVDGSTNYLGADILYTDGFDAGIDFIEPPSTPNASLSFSFYHDDWEDAIIGNQQVYYFTKDIRNHNYNDFLGEGKTWNTELKSIENYYNGTAKLTFNFIEGLSDASITVDVIGSNLSGTSYNINDGASIDGIIMSYNTIVNFDIHISNLCY